MKNNKIIDSPYLRLMIVMIFLFSFGFPGTLVAIIGHSVEMLINYGLFIAEMGVMLMASGKSAMDAKILDLKKRYTPIYLFLLVIFINSMLVTCSVSEQFISCFRFTITALFSLWLVENLEVEEVLKLFLEAIFLACLVTLFASAAFPALSHSYENGGYNLTGFFTTKNPLGNMLSLGVILQYTYYLLMKRKGEDPLKPWFILLFVMQVVIITISHTMTAVLTTVAVCFILFCYDKKILPFRLPVGIIYTVASVGFLLFSQTILPMMGPFFESIGKDPTLTGRVPLWKQLVAVMLNHNTWTGFGFSMFWRDEEAVKLFHEGFSSGSWGNTMTYGAHNTLIELWLEIGITGMALYCLMFLVCFRNVKTMSEKAYILSLAVVMTLTLRGITERSYTTYNYLTMFLFYTMGVAAKYREAQETRAERFNRIQEKKKKYSTVVDSIVIEQL